MKITLMTTGGKHMGLSKVLPKDLEMGQCYVCVAKLIDDYSGEETFEQDLMFVTEAQVTKADGSGMKAKLLSFLKTQHKSLLSQLATPCTFFGPLVVDIDTSVEEKVVRSAVGGHVKANGDADISVLKDQ